MNTYFETYYPSGNLEVQLSDNYFGFGITRSGTLTANLSNGEIYGLELSPQESFVIARTNNDTLIVSPTYKLTSGNSVVYLGTQNGASVQYKVVSLSKNITHNEHNAGIEIYNGQGELIFTNTVSVPQFEHGYIANALHFMTDDYGYVLAELCYGEWEQITINDSSNKYIYSMQTPFGLNEPFEAAYKDGRPWLYAGGYTFANNKITTLTRVIGINGDNIKLLGGGNKQHFGVQYTINENYDYPNWSYWCGLWNGMYQFATMLA
jgi:hypothetical protein